MKYCPQCASTLEVRHVDGGEKKACPVPSCGFVHWDNPVPVVAAVVQYADKVVLARNVAWPRGMFSFITGYLNKGEDPDSAVRREVEEELGLESCVKAFIGCYSLGELNQVILAHWMSASGELALGPEIAEVRLVSRLELEVWDFGPLTMTSAILRSWMKGWR